MRCRQQETVAQWKKIIHDYSDKYIFVYIGMTEISDLSRQYFTCKNNVFLIQCSVLSIRRKKNSIQI